MVKVFTIAFNDLRIYFSQRGNLIGLVLIPIILASVLGFTSVPPATTYTLDIVDLDNTAESQQLIDDIFATNDHFVGSNETVTVDAARRRVAEEIVDAALIIPEDFARNLHAFSDVELRYFSNEDSTGGAIQPGIMSVIGRWNSAVIASRSGQIVVDALEIDLEPNAIYDRATDFIAREPVQYEFSLTNSERELQPGEGFGQSVPGFGSMFVMFTVFSGMAVLFRERQTWTMQRLIVMPVSRSQVIAGKILTYFTLGMIQFLILFGFGAIMGLQMSTSWLALLLIMLVYTLAVTALSFAIASSIRSEGQANNLTTLLGISLAALGGAWWSLEVVPPIMKVIGHLSPVAWAMDAFTQVIYFNGTVIDVLPYLAILMLIAGILFVVAVQRFRYD